MAANYRDAIAAIESGGNYREVGPAADAEGHRAYGRYQVMDYNIGPWTEEALGRRMSSQEFLASPEAQDVVFDHVFGGYVEKYGPQGAAQAWFGGPGSVGSGGGGTDVLGTSGTEYVRRFNAALGTSQPTATASGSQQPLSRIAANRMQRQPTPGGRAGYEARRDARLSERAEREEQEAIDAWNSDQEQAARERAAAEAAGNTQPPQLAGSSIEMPGSFDQLGNMPGMPPVLSRIFRLIGGLANGQGGDFLSSLMGRLGQGQQGQQPAPPAAPAWGTGPLSNLAQSILPAASGQGQQGMALSTPLMDRWRQRMGMGQGGVGNVYSASVMDPGPVNSPYAF